MKRIAALIMMILLAIPAGCYKAEGSRPELFYKKLLNECEKMEGFLNNKDLHNFAVLVHGKKSSLSAIGAMELIQVWKR